MLPKWNLADVRSRMFNTPLLVTRDRALSALGVMGPKLDVRALVTTDGTTFSSEQLRSKAAAAKAEIEVLPGDDRLKKHMYIGDGQFAEVDPYEIWNGAAIFEVRGTLMAENGIDPISGATGYDGLSRKSRHALANPNVKGAILDIDSGGGEVVDLLELCSQLRRFAKTKPLRAVVRGSACSAAYALAACAGPGNITGAPYSVVGSIGAIMLHADFSKQLEEEGIDVTLITSADHKADASPIIPLAEGVEAKLQGMVNDCAAAFIDHVADSRSMDRDAIVSQQAAFFSGEEALSLGLIDKFMSWDESMKEFAESLNARTASVGTSAPTGARSAGKGTSMSSEANAPAAGNQPEFSQADIDAARAEGHAAGVTEGANAERERMTALAELDEGSTISEPLASAIADGTSPGDFAIALTKGAQAKRSAAAEAAKAEAVDPGKLPEGSAAANPSAPKANRGEAAVARNRGKFPGLPANA